MFKKVAIKLFKLNDIQNLLIKAKVSQRELDRKFWEDKLKDTLEEVNNEHSLEIQDYQSQITLLQDQLNDYQRKGKELEQKDYFVKKQAKDNSLLATQITSKVEDFGLSIMKIIGEMKGIEEEAQRHRERIIDVKPKLAP